MATVHRGRGYVFSVQYHVVWCVKFRRKVLDKDVGAELLREINKIADDHGVVVLEANTGHDHIHLLLDCAPQHYIPNLIKAFKGVSARALFKKFPDLKEKLWKGHLWNPSYFVATVSENTEEQIRRYIQSQQEK